MTKYILETQNVSQCKQKVKLNKFFFTAYFQMCMRVFYAWMEWPERSGSGLDSLELMVLNWHVVVMVRSRVFYNRSQCSNYCSIYLVLVLNQFFIKVLMPLLDGMNYITGTSTMVNTLERHVHCLLSPIFFHMPFFWVVHSWYPYHHKTHGYSTPFRNNTFFIFFLKKHFLILDLSAPSILITEIIKHIWVL